MVKDIFPFFWQILSQLDIIIRLEMLLDIFIKVVQNSSEFSEGVPTMFPFPLFTVQSPLTQAVEGSHMATPVSGVSSELGELSSNLSCFIMELDLLVKQVISSSRPITWFLHMYEFFRSPLQNKVKWSNLTLFGACLHRRPFYLNWALTFHSIFECLCP